MLEIKNGRGNLEAKFCHGQINNLFLSKIWLKSALNFTHKV
ncbi:hypothetical protein CSUNSWCD_2292 [Campylobacter showae CSUNSWCD]|uniref:Uncharacterized protein n=1 Tax=Campylobacter showae CSUNSWCD TaxID=1244083 RepID=M5IPW7_9BACT|nr:hypothetical protein CSUNSWCD_2292 [Campylobacter showae CSUNSWCD]